MLAGWDYRGAMAELVMVDGQLVLSLSSAERLGAVHNDIEVPVDSIESITRVESAYDEVHGLRLPGTAVPGRLLLGTWRPWRRFGSKDFIAVSGRGPGVVIGLVDHEFTRIVTTAEVPVELAPA